VSNQKTKSAKFTHPLSGANLSTLVQLVRDNAPIPAACWPRLAFIFLAAAGRWPLTVLEKILTRRWLRRMPPMPAPVFIIGHWRSGTTHLGNILSKDPQFGFVTPIAAGIPWELLTIGRLFRRSLERQLPESRLIDNVPVKPDSPQEDEFGISNMLPFSFLHSYYFPTQLERNLNKGVFFDGCSWKEIERWKDAFEYYLKKVYIHQEYKRLVIRNPVYMARIRMIKEIFPEARFIHIYRNPYRIFLSMRNFYKKLLPVLSLQPYDKSTLEEVILATYERLMTAYREQSAELRPQELVEIRFEDLEAAPGEQLKRAYDQLGIDHFEEAWPYFEKYLNSITRYKKNKFQKQPEDLTYVRERWAPYFEERGYAG
jgi:hypothetical protein